LLPENSNKELEVVNNPASPMLLGILPAVILIAGIIIAKRLFHH
jgi:hypothetical protein